ncbi:penicillin acylase family protein [Lacimicrobium alkaliphilum]|uniref:Peptidase n=1 Tax=Lacimicrobium alkaliphilum TaxID=1526571 RepID=A0ABQ1RGU1_9ALTE|nr:penicillin acylase family protein [Lacimicrobium alkaliphilum]GGD67894.1 peptidase [Lacimicrobium alkaliphilum]
MSRFRTLPAIKLVIAALFALAVILSISAFVLLRASLPQLEGQLSLKGLGQSVSLNRDRNGMAVIDADNRRDLAMATGFVHAQERFFQMDLLRRNAAGELSFLFGRAALERDREIGLHRFRQRARERLNTMPAKDKALLDAYADGVNQGIRALSAKPFEYYLIQAELQPWQAQDTLLVLFSMYLDLQYHDGRRDLSLDLIKRYLPAPLYNFLHPAGSHWDAPVDNSVRAASKIPPTSWPKVAATANVLTDGESEDLLPGSNNWAVGGQLTPYGSAMLANDMHLGIRVPNIWYRLQLNWQDHSSTHQVTGLSLPGTPLVVVGTNTRLAWGFTNSYGDWSDLIRLKLDETGERYLTPQGYTSFSYPTRNIEIKGEQPEKQRIKETIWGPVIGEDENGRPLVYRWVAHDPQGANLNLLAMEAATDVEQGVAIAASVGIPAQNIMLADAQGNIGWTIAGPMPIRFGFDGRYISDWSDGSMGWAGYRQGADYPTMINPQNQRLWTANSRVIGGKDYDKIGDGGYALGARAQQIRDQLLAKTTFTEDDFLAIQMDNRALFLSPWRDLMLTQILPESSHPQASVISQLLNNWSARADSESLAYLLVRQFRLTLRDTVYQDLLRLMQEKHPDFSYRAIRNQLEIPLWQLVTEQPTHLLPEGFDSWASLFELTLKKMLQNLTKEYGNWQELSWGKVNQVQIKHPLSDFVPLLGILTDMPQRPLAGDSFMPNVSRHDFGASQRLVVSPGQEQHAILNMPSSQSGHPLTPYFNHGHEAWRTGEPTPLLPGRIDYRLKLTPDND